jgi:hypothetical protein
LLTFCLHFSYFEFNVSAIVGVLVVMVVVLHEREEIGGIVT